MAHAAESVPVYVSITPQKDFAQQIDKDLVDDRLKKMFVDPLADQFKTTLQ